jgi:hypothetical protein
MRGLLLAAVFALAGSGAARAADPVTIQLRRRATIRTRGSMSQSSRAAPTSRRSR